jgi:hypothetical protein
MRWRLLAQSMWAGVCDVGGVVARERVHPLMGTLFGSASYGICYRYVGVGDHTTARSDDLSALRATASGYDSLAFGRAVRFLQMLRFYFSFSSIFCAHWLWAVRVCFCAIAFFISVSVSPFVGLCSFAAMHYYGLWTLIQTLHGCCAPLGVHGHFRAWGAKYPGPFSSCPIYFEAWFEVPTRIGLGFFRTFSQCFWLAEI